MAISLAKLPTLQEIQAEESRRSLSKFVRHFWHVVEPGTPLVWNWHIDAICEHLEAVTRRQIQLLLINIPPGHMKSLIVSVFWPAWEWIETPAERTLFSSYAMDLALRDSVRCRDILTSDQYREWFAPSWSLRGDNNNKTVFENTEKGFRFCLSVGGRATGFRGNKIVTDDPLNAKEMHSIAAREECIFWWDKVMSTRLNDPRTGAKVIIMQRLHEDDLSGHVLQRGGYEHLCLPSEYDPARRSVTSIGWQDNRTHTGELLFPELFTVAVLRQLKVDLGSSDYAGQHQQIPTPDEGGIFKTAWFEHGYTKLPKMVEAWTTWDTALKAGQQNDETACVTAGRGEDGDVYVLRMAHGRWETPDVAKFLVAQAKYYKSVYGDAYLGDYVEDKVSGTTLMQFVRRSNPTTVLIPIKVDSDKVTRAHGVIPLCEALRVHLPDPNYYHETRAWSADLLTQLKVFPNGSHDDIVDAFVYALKRFMGTIGSRRSKRGRGTGGQV